MPELTYPCLWVCSARPGENEKLPLLFGWGGVVEEADCERTLSRWMDVIVAVGDRSGGGQRRDSRRSKWRVIGQGPLPPAMILPVIAKRISAPLLIPNLCHTTPRLAT